MSPDTAGTRSSATVIWPHLQQARWFAGKGRDSRLRALTPLPWLEPESFPAVRFEIAEIEYAAAGPEDLGEVEYYLLALSYRTPSDPLGPGLGVAGDPELGPVSIHPAVSDPAALDLLLRFVSADQRVGDEGEVVVNHLLNGSRLRVGLHPRPFAGEQSNTSVRYGEVALLKLFRRLEPGPNLDIEVHRELADGAASGRVPGLYGWISGRWLDSEGHQCEADLAMLVEQLREPVDGWDEAIRSLVSGDDFTAHASELGRALREVHTGLAAAFGTDTVPGREFAEAMRLRMTRATTEVAPLRALNGPLDSRIFALDGMDLEAQRVHGDFHLGQTLLAGPEGIRTWHIIDFEGEPLADGEQRRTFDTPWRDVAGMLRSFGYAGAFAERTEGVRRESAEDWVNAVSAAFVAAYADGDLTDTEQVILRSYQIDKAVYECLYEARNRPEWLPIPLSALAGLVGETDPRNAMEA